MVIGITTDFTKRKSLQKELEKQKNYFQTIISSAPNLIYVKDWNGTYQIENEEMVNFYDMDQGELIGKTDLAINPHADGAESYLSSDCEAMRSGEIKKLPEEVVTNRRTGKT